MLRALVLALSLSAFVAVPARARDFGPFTGAEPEVTKLDNGLTVITVPWASPGILAYYTLVRVGSRDEIEPGHSGFAHLFEHMMFSGTEKHSRDAYERVIQSFGADNNAYTTNDFTLYTVTAPASALEAVVELEADRFQHLSYDEATFKTETGAVLGEYNKSAADPSQQLWETLSELSFAKHTYRHTTIGYLADIKAMPTMFEYSRAFFRRYYTPDNCTLIVAGDASHARVVELVKQRYGAWKGARDRPKIPAEPAPMGSKSKHLEWQGSAPRQSWVAYRAPAFAATDEALRDAAALAVIHGLAFSESSPLYRRLVVDERKLLELESWASERSVDPGLFVVSATLADGTSFADIERDIQLELDRIANGQTEPRRIDDVRSHLRYAFTADVETASDAAETLGQFLALVPDVNIVPRYLRAIAELTAADVARVAKRYLTPKARSTVTLAPASKAGEP